MGRGSSPGRAIAALALAASIAGCATTENYRQLLASWMGKDAKSLVRAWGPPVATVQLPEGNTRLIYDRTPSVTMPFALALGVGGRSSIDYQDYSRPGPARVPEGEVFHFWCRTELDADRSGRLIGWRFEGNGCTARRTERALP